jgi:hypothetical protein
LRIASWLAFSLTIAMLCGCGESDPFVGTWALAGSGADNKDVVVIAKADEHYAVYWEPGGHRRGRLLYTRHGRRLSCRYRVLDPDGSVTGVIREAFVTADKEGRLGFTQRDSRFPSMRVHVVFERVSSETSIPPATP